MEKEQKESTKKKVSVQEFNLDELVKNFGSEVENLFQKMKESSNAEELGELLQQAKDKFAGNEFVQDVCKEASTTSDTILEFAKEKYEKALAQLKESGHDVEPLAKELGHFIKNETQFLAKKVEESLSEIKNAYKNAKKGREESQ
ncbi:hypothetical protein WDW89_17075 [Deltaproteobacteria bacterium TL4]